MARGQSADAAENAVEPEKKQEKIHLGDTPALKKTLDDCAIEVLKYAGYDINYVYTDTKIAIGFLACAVACVAQFYPGKYPDTFWVLVACVSVYTILSIALSAFHTFVEKDIIALTRGPSELIIRAKFPRYQDMYTFAIRPQGTAPDSADEVKFVKSVGRYFTADGTIVAENVKTDVLDLVAKLDETSGDLKKSQ